MTQSGPPTDARTAAPTGLMAAPHPPHVFIARPRIDAELDRASRRPLTMIVAPAGSGKTAALAQWASTSDEVGWLVARPGAPAEDLAMALLASASVPVDGSIATDDVPRLLRDAAPGPKVLVVDDAHHLTLKSWQLLDAAVTQAPDQVRAVLASRRDAPLPTVTLELSESLTVLRADVLRFDDHEARLLVAAHAPDATDDDLLALQDRAHGWAAALVLGARSLAAASDRRAARLALTHTDQPVLDYLLGEVFETMPAGTRHVLLCTVDEPVVTADLAVMLSGDLKAPDLLTDLAAEGLLVTAFEADDVAWAYHPLLRELLRRQVAVDGPDHALAVAAHARAARHHALHGQADVALRHSVAAGEHDLTTELLVDRGPALLSAGHEQLVSDALGSLPDEMTETHPALLGVSALLMRTVGQDEQAVRLATLTARAARQLRAGLGDGTRRVLTTAESALLADSALLNAWLARLGWYDVADALAGARSAVGEEPGDAFEHAAALDPARLSWLLHELAVLETWVGDVEAASRHADEGVLTGRAMGLDRQAAAALADRAVLQLLDGQFQTAANTALECLAAAARVQRQDDGYMGRPHLVLGWAAFYDLQLDAAAEALAEVRRIEAHAFDPLVAALAQVLDARLVAERGDVARARRLLADAPPRLEPAPAYLEGIYAVVRAHWALVDGDVAGAEAEVPVMRRLGWDVSTLAFEAVIADLRGHPATAEEKLEQALSVPAHGEQLVCAAFAAAYSARLHLQAGQVDAARDSLRDALSRAAPQRMLHPLLASAAAGPAYDDLLVGLTVGPDRHPFAPYAAEAAQRYHRPYRDLSDVGPAVPHQGRAGHRPMPGVVAARRALAVDVTDGAARSRTPLPPQPLTGREAEVLRELALGGSYRDVADALVVTENTVKTHVSSLYRKLGVERRADALRMAREIGLI